MEYGSIPCVGLAPKKNGGPIKFVLNYILIVIHESFVVSFLPCLGIPTLHALSKMTYD